MDLKNTISLLFRIMRPAGTSYTVQKKAKLVLSHLDKNSVNAFLAKYHPIRTQTSALSKVRKICHYFA